MHAIGLLPLLAFPLNHVFCAVHTQESLNIVIVKPGDRDVEVLYLSWKPMLPPYSRGP